MCQSVLYHSNLLQPVCLYRAEASRQSPFPLNISLLENFLVRNCSSVDTILGSKNSLFGWNLVAKLKFWAHIISVKNLELSVVKLEIPFSAQLFEATTLLWLYFCACVWTFIHWLCSFTGCLWIWTNTFKYSQKYLSFKVLSFRSCLTMHFTSILGLKMKTGNNVLLRLLISASGKLTLAITQ